MSFTHVLPEPVVTGRERRLARRAARAARHALAVDLAAFETPAELTELSAILERYDDRETETLRRLVNWDRAA